ncbi:MAG TPA: signal recognition particle-docking protein FtsY [Rickettsiales bacterium]|nr:signal recognition particle-docking protein FtsY [Rickettsiales bacterium]
MNWLSRLKSGLSKTSSRLAGGIAGIFTKRKLDKETLEELEELLVQADMGAKTASKVVGAFGTQRLDKEISPEEINTVLAEEISKLLTPVARPLEIDKAKNPYVIIVVGVNGNGKTTTIGKLAKNLQHQGHKVMLAAADTFRAAAVEQLEVWAQRNQCEIVTGAPNAEPASVAYKAIEEAKQKGADVLMIDSAGRLHNKSNLMAELQKIIKVIKKLMPEAPHAVIQVLDATTGQNAINQVEVFSSMVNVTGLVVTKLDGTAKGGIVVALADKFGLPIHAIGVGEGIDDLQPFVAKEFAENLFYQE